MQSNSLKQAIICGLIFIGVGVLAFFIKGYYFPNNDAMFSVDIENKEKYYYNEYSVIDVTNDVLVQRYFFDYKEKILNDTKESYEMLDSNTKEKYGTYSEFKNYIESKHEQIKNSYVVKFTIEKNGSKTNYIVFDQYDNQYTFVSSAVLVYEVILEFTDEIPSIFG